MDDDAKFVETLPKRPVLLLELEILLPNKPAPLVANRPPVDVFNPLGLILPNNLPAKGLGSLLTFVSSFFKTSYGFLGAKLKNVLFSSFFSSGLFYSVFF
jgi:hypothetical protein